MSSRIGAQDEEMARAETLPQADASSLVDAGELEAQVKSMYGQVAREEEAELHFEVGRGLAEHLGYPPELLDAIPAEALASFAGVGYRFLSDRALDACSTYEVQSISLTAIRELEQVARS